MASAVNSMDDIWFVQLPNGNVRAWSLDELDAEFQKGTIDESTLVRQGVAPWSKLSVLLGLDAAPPPSSLAPMQMPSAAPPPVVMSVDDDLELLMAPRSRKRGLVVGLVAAALVLCGGVFALTKATSGEPTAAAGSAPQGANASIAQIAATPPPPPQAPAAQAPAQLDAPKGAPLTDLQRKALLEGDKNRERASKEKKDKKAKAAPPRRAPKSASPFHKGGSKNDPLNISF